VQRYRRKSSTIDNSINGSTSIVVVLGDNSCTVEVLGGSSHRLEASSFSSSSSSLAGETRKTGCVAAEGATGGGAGETAVAGTEGREMHEAAISRMPRQVH
jgi:hypothetical protein